MKRIGKWLLLALGALGSALLIVVVLAMNFDWNRAKPWLSRTLSQTLARSVQIDGPLRVSWQRDSGLGGWRAWVPSPHVSADKVTVGNSAWARVQVFGTADRIEFDLALLPLLSRRIAIQFMRFTNPEVAMERLEDGRDNWSFTDTPTTWHARIGRIAVDHAAFSYFDHAAAIDIAGRIVPLGQSIAFDQGVTEQVRAARREVLESIGAKARARFEQRAEKRAEAAARRRRDGSPQRYAFNWSATGTLRKAALKGSGKLGGEFYLRSKEQPFPLLGDVHVGSTHIVLAGTLTDPADLDALDLRLWVAGPNLSDLYDIAGLAMPNSTNYAMEGHLTGQFSDEGTALEYRGFTARVGQSDLSGDLRYEGRKARPRLTGKIESDELQFRDLAPLIGADEGTSEGAGKLIPATPFRPQRWRAMDADIAFSGDRVFRDSQLPIHKVASRIVLDDGVLSLDPLRFRYAWGDVDATLRLDGRNTPIKAKFDLNARGMQLKHLLPADAKDVTLGRADGEAHLAASGNSVGSLLGAASGELKLLLDQGSVSKALIETAGLNVPNVLFARLFGDKQVKIDCAAADFRAKGGVFDARTFVVDTDIALIKVDGTVDLGREWIDLVVHPQSKGVRVLSLHSPLHVRGPFRNIDVSVDKGALIARAAAAIGLAAVAAPAAALVPLTSTHLDDTSGNRCEALLEQAATPAAARGKGKAAAAGKDPD
jgi:uncharacterized protein involved in outer membrane biogenesis